MWEVIIRKYKTPRHSGDENAEHVDAWVSSRHGDYKEALVAADDERPYSEGCYYFTASVEPQGD